MPSPFSVLTIDDDMSEDAQTSLRMDAQARLKVLAAGPRSDLTELIAQMRLPVTLVFGSPCPPFVPLIHRLAAEMLEAIAGDTYVDPAVAVDLVARLAGFYAIGPLNAHWVPEFGYRLNDTTKQRLDVGSFLCRWVPGIATLFQPSVCASKDP